MKKKLLWTIEGHHTRHFPFVCAAFGPFYHDNRSEGESLQKACMASMYILVTMS